VPGEQLAQRRVVTAGQARDQLVVVHRLSIAHGRGKVRGYRDFSFLAGAVQQPVLALGRGGAGTAARYLLKDRVPDVSDFIDAISRVADGGTVLDPEVVARLLNAGRHRDALERLTPRERQVLALLAQGRSNAAIAIELFISPKVVEKHVANIFDKLGLAPSDDDNRRVLAAIRYLES